MEFELKYFFNELDSNKKYCKLEPHEYFGAPNSFPLDKDIVLLDTNFPCSIENIHNVP